MAWLAPVEGMSAASSTCRRIAVAPGVEVLIDEQHPALRLNGDTRRHRRGAASGADSVVGLEPVAARRTAVARPVWSEVRARAEMVDESG